jgi:hypothetical protein
VAKRNRRKDRTAPQKSPHKKIFPTDQKFEVISDRIFEQHKALFRKLAE